MYAHYGKPADVKYLMQRLHGVRTVTRTTRLRLSSRCYVTRKNQALMVIQSFSNELDPRDPMTLMIVADSRHALAKEVAPTSQKGCRCASRQRRGQPRA